MLVDILFYFSFEDAFLFFFWGRRRHFLYYFWTFFRKQIVCKGPLYLLETGFVAPASDLARATLWSPVLPVVPCFFFHRAIILKKGSTSELGQCLVAACSTLGLFLNRSIILQKRFCIGARTVPSARVLDPGIFSWFDHP